MRVACLQLNSQDDVSANLATVARLLTQAADQGAALAALPEMFAFMHPDRQRKWQFATEEAQQIVLPFLADQARRHQLSIIGGSLLLANDDQTLRNCCPVFSATGDLIVTYDKIHLFDSDLADRSYRESEQVSAGQSAQLVTLNDWNIGLSICYDLRFAELFLALRNKGAELIMLPAAFTLQTGKDHWEVLLRARAIETQCYVAAAAQVGGFPAGGGTRYTFGNALIADPWGSVVARVSDRPGHAAATLDLDYLADVRQRLPVEQHRRLGQRS